MGEAKRKREELRASMIEDVERWSFPPSKWEVAAVEEISALPLVMVPRAPADQLAWARMKPQECHANARFMEQNDPNGTTQQVFGWWLQQGQFVLHSVIRQAGQLICVTPSLFNDENPFPFVPDAKIEAREEGEHFVCYRNGHRIGPGLRSDPEVAMHEGRRLRERLESGMNPYKAIRK